MAERSGCSAMVDMLAMRHVSRCLQWSPAVSTAVSVSAAYCWGPVVVVSARSTMIHTGCVVVIALASK